MNSFFIPNTRAAKSEQTKAKIIKAMDFLLSNYDYDALTIRNICKAAEVSYGSFYHFFDSKDACLVNYVTNEFKYYRHQKIQHDSTFSSLDNLNKIKSLFLYCAEYNLGKGYKHISSFYNPKNINLYPTPGQEKNFSFLFSPIYTEAYLLFDGKNEVENLVLNNLLLDMVCAFNGYTFNWCISRGQFELLKNLDDGINSIINNYRNTG